MEKIVTIKGKKYPARIKGNAIVIVDGDKEHELISCGGHVHMGGKEVPRIHKKFDELEQCFPQYFPKEPDKNEPVEQPEKPKAGQKSGKKKTKKTGTK